MIPEHIRAKYPNLMSALLASLNSEGKGDNASEINDQVLSELFSLLNSSEFPVIAQAMTDESSPEAIFAFGIAAYQRLRVTEEVRRFVGMVWSHAMSRWDSKARKRLLDLTVDDPHQVFFALDLTAEMLKHVTLTRDEALSWIVKAHSAVSKDLMQRGFWLSFQALSERSPAEATSIVQMWLALSPDESARKAIAKTIGYIRRCITVDSAAIQSLQDLEQRLRAGHPSWRAIWIRSWAENIGAITEEKALEICGPSTCLGTEEQVAGVYLRCAIAQENRVSWPWVIRELRNAASGDLQPEAKYWITVAALGAITTTDPDAAAEWQRLFSSIMPIPAELDGIWKTIEHHLVEQAEKSPEVLRSVLKDLAHHSGKGFIEQVRDHKLSYLINVLAQKGLHRSICTDLCFESSVPARKLGLLLFAECRVDHLEETAVKRANEKEVALLLLEAQRTAVDYAALARFHACLARRVDELDGELPFLFYDEVALQALNTHTYRESLKREACSHEYIRAILDDVDQRLTETLDAARSPALQMEIPHRNAAETLSQQRMMRDVAKGVQEHSVFLSLCRKVTLTYGGHSWRTFMPNGTLGDSSEMHVSSATVEVPRMEVIDLEGMHLRRLRASIVIAKLEAESSTEAGQ